MTSKVSETRYGRPHLSDSWAFCLRLFVDSYELLRDGRTDKT